MTTAPTDDHRNAGQGKPFLQHLRELRNMLIRSLAVLVLGMAIAAPLAPHILDLLKRPLIAAGRDPSTFLRTLEVAGGFSITMRIMLWGGLVLAAPVILLLVASFVAPGLTRRERGAIRSSSLFAFLLFAGGVLLGYYITLPVALQIMFRISQWVGVEPGPIMITNYVTFCLRLLLGFGVAFELPVVVLILGSLGVVSATQLRQIRPYVLVFLLILAMILTPPDVFTQLLMAVPLMLLYEVSILVLRVREHRRQSTSP